MPAPCGVGFGPAHSRQCVSTRAGGSPSWVLQIMYLKGLWDSHLLGSGCLESASELQGQVAIGYGSGSLDQVRLGEALLHAMM